MHMCCRCVHLCSCECVTLYMCAWNSHFMNAHMSLSVQLHLWMCLHTTAHRYMHRCAHSSRTVHTRVHRSTHCSHLCIQLQPQTHTAHTHPVPHYAASYSGAHPKHLHPHTLSHPTPANTCTPPLLSCEHPPTPQAPTLFTDLHTQQCLPSCASTHTCTHC